jgi:hypothetical protein
MLVIDPEMDLDDLFNQAGINTSWVDISVKQSVDKLVGENHETRNFIDKFSTIGIDC